MAHSRFQLGPCCTVPIGGEGYVGTWEVWDVPVRHLREAKRDALARLRHAERKRSRSRRRLLALARHTETRA